MGYIQTLPGSNFNADFFSHLRSRITHNEESDLYTYEMCLPYDIHLLSSDSKNRRVFSCYAMCSDNVRGWYDYSYFLNQDNLPKILACTKTEIQATSILHRHNFFEIMFVISGSVDQMIEGERCHFQEGDICLLNREVEHAEVFFTDFSCAYLCLSREYLEKALMDYIPVNSPLGEFFTKNLQDDSDYKKDYINFLAEKKHFTGDTEFLLNRIMEEHIGSRPGYQHIITGLILRLISRLQDPHFYNCDHVRLDTSSDSYIFTKVTRLMEHSPRMLTRGELAETLCYNGDYINRVIKRKTGLTIGQYNRSIQLRKAELLLRGTELSMAEIISLLGYENRTYFYRLFREKNGLTPQEYRDRFGKNGSRPVLAEGEALAQRVFSSIAYEDM